jgi:replicative DNA helicase
MSKFNEIQEENKLRRERVVDGKYNCLPFPFERFRRVYPGIEQGKILILSANQKVGKSKLADYLFIYEPLFYSLEHPELKVKVLYFSLEMSAKEKYNEFLCHLLSRLDKIHIDTRRLRSVDRPCDPHIFELLESERYQRYIQAYENMILFDDVTKNPTGVNKKCREYALEHGHLNYTTVKVRNEVTGEMEDRKVIDPLNPYTQDDEDEYRIIILDNAANLTVEKGCKDLRDTIEKMSKYNIILRKQLNYIVVFIQHQSQSQEGIENIKLDRMRPTVDGLGDCKTTARDASCIIGLYSPAKFNKKTYLGYNIERLKDHCRFLEILDDRDYGANGNICPLFFDGATSTFKELPKLSDTESLEKFYRYAEYLNSRAEAEDLQLTP